MQTQLSLQNKTPHKIRYYMDHNATTPLNHEVVDLIPQWLQAWGNPSSIHWASRMPKLILRETRKALAEYFKVSPVEIVFNSGASESNNTVIKSIFENYRDSEKNHYLCSSVEHPSVIQSMKYIQRLGAQVDFIPVFRTGEIDLEFIQKKLSHRTALVSVMLANNETGGIFPISKISQMAHEAGALMHTDAVQALGKLEVNIAELGVDFASFSAHKFYALKGCGILFIKKGSVFPQPIQLIHGGNQERGRRGGTENILAIAALGEMTKKLNKTTEQSQRMQILRDLMETKIRSEISGVRITGGLSPRLSNTSSLVLDNVEGETLLMALDMAGFAVSTGAACSSGNPEPSPTLLSMGLSRKEAQSSLRVSLGWETTFEVMELFVSELKRVVDHIRTVNSRKDLT